ncbi:peptide ABC transporter substrate-binding protein [Candidatus Peregrinibacteria bacterium]|nr:peptide ABC transporter substrate-binding protein [Candidatus Peregrinibacteria bacterium]
MNTAAKLLHIFFSMSRKEKGAVLILCAGFIIALVILIISSVRFPAKLEKGTFSEGVVGHIQAINPLFADFNETDRDISALVFSGLIRYDPAKRNFFPDLAVTWNRGGNGLEYRFTIRTDAFWHDGKPVTADDIVFTFKDVVQDPGFRNPILKNAFEGVAVEKMPDGTVAFTLPKANSYFLSNLTIGILPKHLLENTPIANFEKSEFGIHPVGSGPYRITALKLDEDGDRIDLSAFPQYYGQQPLIPRIRIFTFPDEKMLMKERGALHALGKLGSEGSQELAKDDRFAIAPYNLNQFTAVFFNTDLPLLKERRVRQALRQALDKNALLSAGEKRIDTIGLSDQNNEAVFGFDPAAANKTLDNLGWKKQPNGFRLNNKGETVSLTLLAPQKIPLKLTEKIKKAWEDIGIQVTVERPDQEEFINLVSERRYSVLLIKQSLGYNRDVYSLFHSSQRAGPEGNPAGLNFAQFKSFLTDGLTEAMRREQDPQAKQKLLEKLSKAITEETPVVFLSTPVYSYALDKRIQPFPADAVLDFHADRFRILPYLSFPSLDKLRMSP